MPLLPPLLLRCCHPPTTSIAPLTALQSEGVRNIEPVAAGSLSPEQDQTLLCFVLVDPEGRHAFCRCGGQPWCATSKHMLAGFNRTLH